MSLIDDLNNYWDIFSKEDFDFSILDGDMSPYTYGTTPFETFNQIIQGLKKPKRFIVLGSSIGWQCFYWNRLFPDVPTIGYEIHDVRYGFSKELVKKHRLENIEFYNINLLDADIQDGDLIWENNLCIDPDICDSLNWRVLTRNIDINIVSYTSILSDYKSGDNILLMDEFGFKGFQCRKETLPTSWSVNQPFHILY